MVISKGKSCGRLGNGDRLGHRTAVRIGDGQRIIPYGQSREVLSRGAVAPGIGIGASAAAHGHVDGPARTAKTAHVDMGLTEGKSRRRLGNGDRLGHRTAVRIVNRDRIIPYGQSRKVFSCGTVVPGIGIGASAAAHGHIDGPARTAKTAHVDMGITSRARAAAGWAMVIVLDTEQPFASLTVIV